MNTMDEEMRKVLLQTDAETLKALAEEPGMFAQISGVFQGKMRLWNIYGLVLAFAATVFALWAGWQFFHSTDPRTMILWGLGMGVAVFFSGMLKLWFWMEMNKNAVIREIKRVEWRLAVLAKSLGEPDRR